MLGRLILILVFGLCLPGCAHFHKKKEKPKEPDKFSTQQPSEEPSFQSFLTQLRKAIATKDIPQIASMMTPDFAYHMGATPAQDLTGEGVFQYWDEKGLWSELQLVMKEKFVSNDQFMVAPAQLVYDENFHGYRAGMARVNGAWKFAYFVTDPPQQ